MPSWEKGATCGSELTISRLKFQTGDQESTRREGISKPSMSQKVQYNGRLFDRRHLAAAQMAKDMLSMSDPIMRRLATAALSHVGQAEALKHCQDFVAALKDSDSGVRYTAVVYLSAARSFSGPSPVQEHTAEVAELLEDDDPGIRFWALETLANQGFASAPQATKLQKALEDSDPHCRVAAANAVSKAAPELQEEAAKVLAEALNKHEDKIFRKSGAEGLGYLGEAAMKYLPQIIGTLQKDDYPLARAAAAAALGQLGATAVAKAAESLARRLDDAEQAVRGACRGSLRKLDVGTALRSSEPALRGWAAEVVAGRGSDASVYGEVMAKLLSDESKDVRYWAASALSGMGAAAAEFAAEVEKAVKDPNPDVWPHILRIISLHVTQALDGACTAMVSHFADDDAHRRRCAIRALGSARDSALPFMGEVAKCLESRGGPPPILCFADAMSAAGSLAGLIPPQWQASRPVPPPAWPLEGQGPFCWHGQDSGLLVIRVVPARLKYQILVHNLRAEDADWL
eukprot:s35_g7.t1